MIKHSTQTTFLLAFILLCGISNAQVQGGGKASAGTIIDGTVKEAYTGKALIGISATYEDYSAAITDSNGHFSLKVPSTKVSILLTGEGFQTKEVPLKGRNTVFVDLYEDSYTSLFDAANLPEGQVPLNHSAYPVTSIQTGGAWNSISETPSSYLQGRVAGLNAIRRSGTPNIGATLLLRGISTLYANNRPLIIVDGVIFDNNDFGGSIIYNHYTDPLSTIDVRDIDNITVLKDGSSLYGTKGANGVILITTARSKELGTKIDFAMYGGMNFTPSQIPMMDATQYRTYLSDMLKSGGMSNVQIQAQPYMNDDPNSPGDYDYHNNTNWQDAIFEKTYTRNIYLKVTGGDNIAKYGLSLGYMDNGGVTKATDLLRYNMRFNGDLNLSKRMTATTNLSLTLNEQNLRDQGASPKTNPIFVSLVKSPLLRAHEVSDKGVESPLLSDLDTFNIGNPVVLTDQAQGVNKNYRFLGSIGFNYQLSKELTLSNTLGITNDKVRENFFIPRKGVTTDTLTNAIAYSRLGSQVKSLFSFFDDARATYNKRFNGLHELTTRLGFMYLFNRTERDFGLGYNSAIDELVSVGNGQNALREIGGAFGEEKWVNTYLNADYNYSGKYFASFNIAADASSRFGKNVPDALNINGNKFAVLPSLGLAWLVSAENFMSGLNIDVLKLRASYGLAGNDDIGNYTSRVLYVPQNLLGVQGLVRAGFGNDQLQWERVKKWTGGMDVSIFKERLSFSLDYYYNETSKMIVYEPTSTISGFDYAITNSGKMETYGADLSVMGRLLNKKNFNWDLGFTVGRYDSKIKGLPSPFISSFSGASYLTAMNQVPNVFYGYVANGVFASDAEAASKGLSIRKADGSLVPFKGGDVQFSDLNNDKVIDENDRTVIGNPNPDYFGSITTKATYKNFSLEALFTFVQGNDVYNYTLNRLEQMSDYSNQTQAVINRWRDNGQVTNTPKSTWGDPMGNSRFSNRWIEDGSYLRLRSVGASYNVPMKPGFFKYLVVYGNGNNLLTFTKYKGFDPEFNPSESIYGRGVDNTLEPIVKSVVLGVRVGL
jgi:TonB-linked SusC/RagA family outer membrane protein